MMRACLIGLALFAAALAASCAHPAAKAPPPAPPKFIYTADLGAEVSRNSLYRERAGLFEDMRAKGLNDLVTIKIVESATASKKAETSTSRNSTLDADIDNMFGAPLNMNLANFYGKGNTLDPKVKGGMTNQHTGAGETTRSGTLSGTITARVVEVLPNGNFVVQSRKEITVNRETQILVISGTIRPEDIKSDNTISSTLVADAKMYYTGQGVINDKQGQGWLTRTLDRVWPF